jgi:hypothetical protein
MIVCRIGRNLPASVKLALHPVGNQTHDPIFNTVIAMRRQRTAVFRRFRNPACDHHHFYVRVLAHGCSDLWCQVRRRDFTLVAVRHDQRRNSNVLRFCIQHRLCRPSNETDSVKITPASVPAAACHSLPRSILDSFPKETQARQQLRRRIAEEAMDHLSVLGRAMQSPEIVTFDGVGAQNGIAPISPESQCTHHESYFHDDVPVGLQADVAGPPGNMTMTTLGALGITSKTHW